MSTYFQQQMEEAFPDSLLQLLMEGSLLYHIPYYYFMPNDMISDNELRFFQIDHNWILAYLDGICSPGRNAAIDYEHDTELLVKYYRQALEQQENIRRSIRKEKAITIIQEIGKCSGMLLKGQLVTNFRGLEFNGFDTTGCVDEVHPLPILRIEKLGSDLLLALFHGDLKQLHIGQPPESLHFGCNQDGQGNRTKQLRDLKTGKLYENQEGIPFIMKPSALNIVDVVNMAELMEQRLGSSITSASFALEMIQNAHTGVFTLEEESHDSE